MLEQEHDQKMARNQLIAIILMTAILFVGFQYLFPQPPPVQQPKATPAEIEPGQSESAGPDPSDPAAAPPEHKSAAEETIASLPGLPPVAEPLPLDAAETDEVVLENDSLRLVFTRVGGRLKQAFVKLHRFGDEDVQLVPQPVQLDPDATALSDADVAYPLGLRFTEDDLGERLNVRRFDARQTDPETVVFSLEAPGALRVEKTFRLAVEAHVLEAEIAVVNLSAEGNRRFGLDQIPAYYLTWEPNVQTGEASVYTKPALTWRVDGQNETLKVSNLEPDDPDIYPAVDWTAYGTAYFLVGMKPQSVEKVKGRAIGSGDVFEFGLAAPRFTLGPGQSDRQQFRLYMGPKDRDFLAAAWPTLATTVRFFSPTWDWMDKFAKFLLAIMNWIYSVIPSYGVAIIGVTLLVRTAMFPLTLKSVKSMKRMQALGPEMQELKEKYKDEPQVLNQKMMELYKERGVNPVGGCLPMLLQMPVFIAFYRMLATSYELRGAPFTLFKFGDYQWIADLSQPDRLIHLPFMVGLPFVGDALEYINILPILGAFAIVLSQEFMPTGPVQNDQQKMMMRIMPIFFGVITYTMASGLNLYILTSTVVGILQNRITAKMKDADTPPPPKKKAAAKLSSGGKRKSMYAAAQERRRLAAKEQKQEKARAPKSRGKSSKSKTKANT